MDAGWNAIAKAIGVKPRTVQKCSKALQELGLIKREERRYTKGGSKTKRSNGF